MPCGRLTIPAGADILNEDWMKAAGEHVKKDIAEGAKLSGKRTVAGQNSGKSKRLTDEAICVISRKESFR